MKKATHRTLFSFVTSIKARTFTLIEILIIISVLGMLALRIIPYFISIDTEARVIETRNNLDTLRGKVKLFYQKEFRYPASLGELISESYFEDKVERNYLDRIPPEFISSPLGDASYDDKPSSIEPAFVNSGGWVYLTDKAEVHVDWDIPLDKKWGEYANQNPSEW
jgi:competence protein ComGC